MMIRADVAELLRAGLSNIAIGRQLNVDPRRVERVRRALGIPPVRRGFEPAASPEALFWSRTQQAPDGHLIWTGFRSGPNKTPGMRHLGTYYSAYRLAFRIQYGRAPEGHVNSTCRVDGCVAPAHMQDRIVRDRTNKTFDAIFGQVPR